MQNSSAINTGNVTLRRIARACLVFAAAFGVASCDGPSEPEPDENSTFPFMISNSVAAVAAASVAEGASAQLTSTSVVYVSLQPGALAGGVTASIRNTRTGSLDVVAMVSGGFDPVAITAMEEDLLSLTIEGSATYTTKTYSVKVPKKTRPRVVRTDPPPQKRDVPLLYNIAVIFSEPIAPASLTPSSIQLRRGNTIVPGQLAFADAQHLKAIFIADSPLDPGTDYVIEIAPTLHDDDGDSLEEVVAVPFTTDSGPGSLSLSLSQPEITIQRHGASLTGATVSRGGDFTGGISLAVMSVPSGVNAYVASSAPTQRGIAFMISIVVDSNAALGTHTLMVRAGGVGVPAVTVPLNLVVIAGSSGPPSPSLLFSDIGNVGNFACGLEAQTGLAWCWGDNHAGALGIGDTDATGLPQAVNRGLRYSRLAVGYYNTCGLEAGTGRAYCWGSNSLGQLGDGTLMTRTEPTLVQSGGMVFSSISSGGDVTCAIEAQTDRGYCWGKGGLIGDGTLSQRVIPKLIDDGNLRFSSISAGNEHVCGLQAQTGYAYCWGSNQYGQLGDNSGTDHFVPTLVAGGRSFTSIDAGHLSSCALEAQTGFAYCWGLNDVGQLGDGTTINKLTPTAVNGGRQYSSIVAGGRQSCAIESGTSFGFCWGSNNIGQIGDGTTIERWVPTLVGGGSVRFSSISSSGYDVWGVESQTGAAYWWGWGWLLPARVWDGTSASRPGT